ncbi:MAG: DsbA family protein [Proteobacteria bacterium]|nr:DsbA family protein [Pseudomonadota bacterium]
MSGLRIPVSDKDHIEGGSGAAVTVVEYGDYQCPYCGDAYGIVKQVQQHFGNRMRLVFRNFPLTEIHPQAMAAAVLAEYAATHGKFWQAHDALYEHQSQLGGELYLAIARKLGLPGDGLREAFESGEYAARIQDDMDGGIRSGVNGTPTFFINGVRFEPRRGFEELLDAVQAQLDGAG